MSQVNLLPPEIRQRAQTRRTTMLVIAAGAVVLVLIGFLYFLQSASLSGVNDDIAAQGSKNATVSADIAGLQEFADLQTAAQAKQALLQAAYASEVSFSGVLLDLSRVIPSDAYLTTFTAQVTPAGAAPEGGSAALIGTISAAGEAAGTDSLASWITRLESVKGWVNPWISSFTESEANSGRYTFNSGADLTGDVLTERGAEGAGVTAP